MDLGAYYIVVAFLFGLVLGFLLGAALAQILLQKDTIRKLEAERRQRKSKELKR